jgi:5S rRNA maturation endonuclease (ribonuclease M5)
MPEYTLPYFGKLPIENLKDYYDVDIEFNGNEIQIDLNFENKTIDSLALEKVKNFIENIEKLDKQNKTYILFDYLDEDGDTVKLYLEHHLEDVDKEELSELINFDDTTVEPEQQLLTKLKLVRVGLYPDSQDNFATFDYSIGRDITDYLVVIQTDENGALDYITMES